MAGEMDSTLEHAIFNLVSESEARSINNDASKDEEGDYEDEDELIEAYSECAQEKFDNAENAGDLPEPFGQIIQVCLEIVDWTKHPHFPS